MTSVETAAIAIARAVANQTVKSWLAHRTDAANGSIPLKDLIETTFADKVSRRKIARQIEDVADNVLQRLEPILVVEYSSLTANDRMAALLAVARTIETSDLTDAALFRHDVNSVKLCRSIRESIDSGDRSERASLGDAGNQFYDMLLGECVEDFVHMVLRLQEFMPRSVQEVLKRLSDIGAETGRILDKLPTRRLDAPEGSDFDEEFQHEYRTLISQTLDELEMFGLDVQSYRPRTTLSVAYISLVTRPASDESRRSKARPKREIARAGWSRVVERTEPEGTHVELILGNSPRVLIRGEAGSGKSTLLRWLAISTARGNFSGPLADLNHFTPFLIKLRAYSGGALPSPDHFLDNSAGAIISHMPKGWVDRQLGSGRALVLVDGVDELTTKQRADVRSWLKGLVAAYPSARLVVTSRPAAAAEDWLSTEAFDTANLEPMSPADIRAFIRQWHLAIQSTNNLPAHARSIVEFENALVGRLEGSPHLRSLATSPLLCAMLCALNLDRNKHLPPNRMGLYRAALQLLLNRRDMERDVPSFQGVTLEDEDKMCLIRDLAWRLAVRNRSEVSRAMAVEWIGIRLASMPHIKETAEDVFEHILHRCGVVQEPVPDRIDFVHRTFQEYLAAAEAAEQGHIDILITKAHLDLWREIIVMAAGHANEPSRKLLLEGLLGRVKISSVRTVRRLQLLTAACLETVSSIPAELLTEIELCLDTLIPPRRRTESRSLASAGERILTRMPRSLDSLSSAAAAATVRTVALINGSKSIEVLERWSTDERDAVVNEMIRAWDFFEPREFAQRVLANSPLHSGNLNLSGTSELEYLKYLKHFRGLSLLIYESELNLSVIDQSHNLRQLIVQGRLSEPIDIRTLAGKADGLITLFILSDFVIGLGSIRAFPKLDNLFLSMGRSSLTSLRFLSESRQLHSLELRNAEKVRSYRKLADLVGLVDLSIGGCVQLEDFEAISELHLLQSLNLFRPGLPRGLESLPRDALGNIARLSLRFCDGISDLTRLSQMQEMFYLDLEGCQNVDDLAPLADIPGLRTLDISSCKGITNLAPLARLTSLNTLLMASCDPKIDLSPLADMQDLKIILPRDSGVGRERLGEGVLIDSSLSPSFDLVALNGQAEPTAPSAT